MVSYVFWADNNDLELKKYFFYHSLLLLAQIMSKRLDWIGRFWPIQSFVGVISIFKVDYRSYRLKLHRISYINPQISTNFFSFVWFQQIGPNNSTNVNFSSTSFLSTSSSILDANCIYLATDNVLSSAPTKIHAILNFD